MSDFVELTSITGHRFVIAKAWVMIVRDEAELTHQSYGDKAKCIVTLSGQTIAVQEPYDVVVKHLTERAA